MLKRSDQDLLFAVHFSWFACSPAVWHASLVTSGLQVKQQETTVATERVSETNITECFPQMIKNFSRHGRNDRPCRRHGRIKFNKDIKLLLLSISQVTQMAKLRLAFRPVVWAFRIVWIELSRGDGQIPNLVWIGKIDGLQCRGNLRLVCLHSALFSTHLLLVLSLLVRTRKGSPGLRETRSKMLDIRCWCWTNTHTHRVTICERKRNCDQQKLPLLPSDLPDRVSFIIDILRLAYSTWSLLLYK